MNLRTILMALANGETLVAGYNSAVDTGTLYKLEGETIASKSPRAASFSETSIEVRNLVLRKFTIYTPPVKLLAFEDRTDGEIKFVKENSTMHLDFKDDPTRYKQVELTTDLMLKGAQ